MKRASLGVEAQWVVRLEFAFLRSKLGLKKLRATWKEARQMPRPEIPSFVERALRSSNYDDTDLSSASDNNTIKSLHNPIGNHPSTLTAHPNITQWYLSFFLLGPKSNLSQDAPSTQAFILACLTAGGGITGYARTGSIPSIAAGVTVGALV